MDISRRRFATLTIGATALAGLAACSNDATGGGTAKQELKVAVATLPINMDVLKNSAEGTILGPMQHVFEPLVKFVDSKFQPCLAKSWENPDKLTWIFHLDEKATFSDGTNFTANDVKLSLKRLIDTKSPLAPLFSAVKSIDATDDHTVTFKTKTPLGTLLASLAQVYLCQGNKVNDSDYWKSPVGTGPFTVGELVPDQHLVFNNNTKYWGTPSKLTTLTYVSMPEEGARISALSSGDVDVVPGISADSIAGVKKLKNVKFDTIPSYSTQFIWFNCSRKPYTDRRVRQAMWHALDLEKIIPDLYGDQRVLAQAPITQSVFGAAQEKPYAYDQDLARSLLKQAGYPNGFSTSIQFASAGGNTLPFVQTIISGWADVGIKVKPLPKEKAVWLKDLLDLNWDMNTQDAGDHTGDADYVLARLYTTDAHRLGYSNPKYDALVLKARQSVDQDERLKLYKQATDIIWNDAPAIWVSDITDNAAYRSDVMNLSLDPSGRNFYAGVTIAAN